MQKLFAMVFLFFATGLAHAEGTLAPLNSEFFPVLWLICMLAMAASNVLTLRGKCKDIATALAAATAFVTVAVAVMAITVFAAVAGIAVFAAIAVAGITELNVTPKGPYTVVSAIYYVLMLVMGGMAYNPLF